MAEEKQTEEKLKCFHIKLFTIKRPVMPLHMSLKPNFSYFVLLVDELEVIMDSILRLQMITIYILSL